MAAVKLIVSSRLKSMEKNDEMCEFYLQKKNITPRKPINIKNFAIKSDNHHPNKSQIISELVSAGQDDYADAVSFANLDVKSVDYLLGRILTKHEETTDTNESAGYDVGSYVYYSREDIATQKYVIELTESPTFTVLNMPIGVAVVGDGVYEAMKKRKDAYENNRKKLLVKINNVSQTVNSFAERNDVECQTMTPRTSTFGVQVYSFDIWDVCRAADDGQEGGRDTEKDSRASARTSSSDIRWMSISVKASPDDDDDNDLDQTIVFVERELAQYVLNADRIARSGGTTQRPSPDRVKAGGTRLAHLFTLTLPDTMNRGLAIKCAHWNPLDGRLLAVAYGQLAYHDYGDSPNAVAVWSTKNPYSPERFYEFEGMTVTCLKYSTQYPNRLAIGFQCGEIILIDVVSIRLNVLYKMSKQFPLETNGILDLFWSVRIEDEFPVTSYYECLVACSLNGRVARYHYVESSEQFVEKTVMQLCDVDDGDAAAARKNNPTAAMPVFRASRLTELHQSTAYLVGAVDGSVYSCLYDNSTVCHAKIQAHFGPITSLDRSPFSPDVFLTTGYDCSIKIWVGDIFQKPVITVRTEKQVERAVWSRTNPTVIASIINSRIYVWNVDVSRDKPTSVYKTAGNSSSNKCAGMEFTSDGRRLCVTDMRGNVAVYAWSDSAVGFRPEDSAVGCSPEDSVAGQAPEDSVEVYVPEDSFQGQTSGDPVAGHTLEVSVEGHARDDANWQLMYCIAKSLYGQRSLSKTLQEHRPEYAHVFARLHDEREKVYFS